VPYVSAKEHRICAEEPCISAKELCISAKEPCISANEPSPAQPLLSASTNSHAEKSVNCHLYYSKSLQQSPAFLQKTCIFPWRADFPECHSQLRISSAAAVLGGITTGDKQTYVYIYIYMHECMCTPLHIHMDI